MSWPRGLGFGSGVTREGLGIAFGWQARGTIWKAYARALFAGQALANLIDMVHRAAPERDVHMLGHSLGARVILCALPHMPKNAVRRIILLNGAEYASHAQTALESNAGKTAEIINVTGRENDVYDFILEKLIRSPHRGDHTLGQGIPDVPNTLNLQMDHPRTLQALLRCGFRIAQPTSRMCHQSSYMRPGVFNLYRSLLRRSGDIDLAHLRQVLPQGIEPRWSRIFARPQWIDSSAMKQSGSM